MSFLDERIIVRLIAAFVIGGLIGLNRELHGKPAGFRTHALVCLGAAGATLAALYSPSGTLADPNATSRVAQGILTGIGFLGAGVILHDPPGHVSGLTTAATVWIAAVIGFVAGVGSWCILLFVFLLTGVALVFGGRLEKISEKIFKKMPPSS